MDTLEGYLQKKQERINRVMTPGKSLLQSERTESPRIEAAKKPNEKKITVKSSTVSDSVNSSLVTTRFAFFRTILLTLLLSLQTPFLQKATRSLTQPSKLQLWEHIHQ